MNNIENIFKKISIIKTEQEKLKKELSIIIEKISKIKIEEKDIEIDRKKIKLNISSVLRNCVLENVIQLQKECKQRNIDITFI